MSEIIEHVARAIWALNEDTDCPDYDELNPHARQKVIAWARAAIAAMREPTEQMLDASCTALVLFLHQGGKQPGLRMKHRIRWRAAIDAALKDAG